MPITFDAAYQQALANDTTWNHTVGAGNNGILLVTCGMHNSYDVTGVTFNGVSLTKLGETSGTYRRAQIWYLLNPPAGTHAVVLTGATTISAGSVSFFGVNQESPFRHNTGLNGSSYSPSLSVTSIVTDVVVDVVCGWTWTASQGAGQTLNFTDTFGYVRASSSREDGSDPSTTMSWTASGSDNNYAQYGASLIATLASDGDNTLPLMEITAGQNGADNTLPVLSIEAGQNGAILTLPSIYVMSSWVDIPFKDGLCTLPMVIVEGDARIGTISTGAFTLPSPTIISFGVNNLWDLVNTVDVELPVYTISATALSGGVNEGDCDIPVLTASATHLTGTVSTSNIILPSLSIDSAVAEGYKGASDLPLLNINAIVLPGTISTGSFKIPSFVFYGLTINTGELEESLPVPTISAYAHGPITATLAEELPLLEIIATLVRASTAFRCYVVNTENNAITEYDNFPFNSFCTFKGKHLAAGANGITLLEGDKDNSTDIKAYLNFGNNDFDIPNIKRITDAYFSMKGGGSYYLTVISDDGASHDYPLTAVTGARIKNLKAEPGKGKKGRFFELELDNVNGSDFELFDITLNVELLQRKV
jgi:hypothetical protein